MFRGSRALGAFAAFWFVELVLQELALIAAGEHFASSSLLLVPASLVVFFALSAVAAHAHARLGTRAPTTPVPTVSVQRPDVARIRAELADLGRQRLDRLIDEEEFRVRRDEILWPVTHPVRT